MTLRSVWRALPSGARRAVALPAIALSLSGCMTVDVLGQPASHPGAAPAPATETSAPPEAATGQRSGASHSAHPAPVVRSATEAPAPTAPAPRAMDAAASRVEDKSVDAGARGNGAEKPPSGSGKSEDVSAYTRQASEPVAGESAAQERGLLVDFGARATEVALGMLGRPYRLGGITPEGFDCSGLLYYSFGQLGVSVPRDTQSLRDITDAIPDRLRRIGDLVFFHIRGRQFSHVGLYVGEGRFLHAPASGGEVRIEKLSVGYWLKRYAGTRRLNFAPVNVEAR